MKLPKIGSIALMALLFAVGPVNAGRLLPEPYTLAMEPGSKYTFEMVKFKTPIFEFAPLSSQASQASQGPSQGPSQESTGIPGFADPLGIGVDPQFQAFAGTVHFMDVLGDYTIENDADVDDIELPPDALKGLDYRDDLITPIINGEKRGYDVSILDIKNNGSRVRELNGLPVTDETSPLSLAGFGTVSEYLKPVHLHWTLCPSVEKRVRILANVPFSIRKKFKPRPNTCFNI